MAKPKNEWIVLVGGKEMNTGDNSQLRTSLVETVDKSITGVVTFRKWAKYCTATDKMNGLTKEDVAFRPTQDGLSFPASAIPQVIADLQRIHDYAVKHGMAEYAPDPNKPKANAPKTRKTVV